MTKGRNRQLSLVGALSEKETLLAPGTNQIHASKQALI
jgi:hypothetical protein